MTRCPRPPNRKRPGFHLTLHPEVAKVVQHRVETSGRPLSHVFEDLLRVALGMPIPEDVEKRYRRTPDVPRGVPNDVEERAA